MRMQCMYGVNDYNIENFLQRLQVRLTDDEDPFFFYSLILPESDFQVLIPMPHNIL